MQAKNNILNTPQLIFIRHGETNYTHGDHLKGPQDLPLNPKGKEDAIFAATTFSQFELCEDPYFVCSKLQRAIQTATIISNKLSITINEENEMLNERYYGDFRLHSKKPPDAESDENFEMRISTLFQQLFDLSYEKTVIVVSHQKVFAYVSELFTDSSSKLENGGVCRFYYDGSCWQKKCYTKD